MSLKFALAVLVGCAAASPALAQAADSIAPEQWSRTELPKGRFSVEFPCDPADVDPPVADPGAEGAGCKHGRLFFGIVVADDMIGGAEGNPKNFDELASKISSEEQVESSEWTEIAGRRALRTINKPPRSSVFFQAVELEGSEVLMLFAMVDMVDADIRDPRALIRPYAERFFASLEVNN